MLEFIGGWLAFVQVRYRDLLLLLVFVLVLILAGELIGPMEG